MSLYPDRVTVETRERCETCRCPVGGGDRHACRCRLCANLKCGRLVHPRDEVKSGLCPKCEEKRIVTAAREREDAEADRYPEEE